MHTLAALEQIQQQIVQLLVAMQANNSKDPPLEGRSGGQYVRS